MHKLILILLLAISVFVNGQNTITLLGEIPSNTNQYIYYYSDFIFNKDSVKTSKNGSFEIKISDTIDCIYFDLKLRNIKDYFVSNPLFIYDSIRFKINLKNNHYLTYNDNLLINNFFEEEINHFLEFYEYNLNLNYNQTDSLLKLLLEEKLSHLKTLKSLQMHSNIDMYFSCNLMFKYYRSLKRFLILSNSNDYINNIFFNKYHDFYKTIPTFILNNDLEFTDFLLYKKQSNINYNLFIMSIYSKIFDIDNHILRDKLIYNHVLYTINSKILIGNSAFDIVDSILTKWNQTAYLNRKLYNEAYKFIEENSIWRQNRTLPELEFYKLDGSLDKISNYKNKYIYLHFWGAYCASCIRDFVYFNEMYEKIDTSKLLLINVCYEGQDDLNRILVKHTLKGLNFYSDNQFGIFNDFLLTQPNYMLLGPNNKILEISTDKPYIFTERKEFLK